MNLILGPESMLGRQLCNILPDVIQISHKHYDLVNFDSCRDAFENISYAKNKVVYNLAGFNGGISFNIKNPAEIYYQTAQINLNVLRCCQIYKVDKVISIIASCAYPDFGEKVLEEEDINKGEPNPSVECHGYAKRSLLYYSRQLHKQFGLRTINTILTNCYGPGDRFDVERTKVVGAVVKKLCDAKLNNIESIEFWGTGSPKREIMYCGDAAKSIIGISESYSDYMKPINIGSDQEITIKDLVETVAKLVDFKGEIKWDTNKTDGQMRKKLSTAKMKRYINVSMTPLVEGLQNTVDYYMEKGRFLNR
jgi:GDP-L-fucose synthase